MMEFGFPVDAYVIVNKIVVVNRRAAELPPLPLMDTGGARCA